MPSGSITSNGSARDSLLELVSRKVLPRVARYVRDALDSSSRTSPTPRPHHPLLTEQVRILAQQAIRDDRVRCQVILQDEIDNGRSIESLLVDLIQPAVRHLGYLWNEDHITFSDVTTGTWALQTVMDQCLTGLEGGADSDEAAQPALVRATGSPQAAGPSALFCTLPGSSHRFGMQLLAGYFRRAGWHAEVVEAGDDAALTARLKQTRADIVGFSIASQFDLDRLEPYIVTARHANGAHGAPGIMIGGPLFIASTARPLLTDADMVSGDAPDALKMATAWLEEHARDPR